MWLQLIWQVTGSPDAYSRCFVQQTPLHIGYYPQAHYCVLPLTSVPAENGQQALDCWLWYQAMWPSQLAGFTCAERCFGM